MDREKLSTYRIQVSVGDLGTCLPQIRGDYCKEMMGGNDQLRWRYKQSIREAHRSDI